jgi:hypothetical protein
MRRVSVVDNNSVLIEWEASADPAFESYSLYRYNAPTGMYTLIEVFQLAGITSYIDQSLNTLDSSYCYKVIESDVCGNAVNLNDIESHCTVNISAHMSGLHHTDVQWTPYYGCAIHSYELYRYTDIDTALVHMASLDPSQTDYLDSTSYCQLVYNYRVKATDICGNLISSWSDTASVHGAGIQDRQFSDVIRATVVNDESVWIEWTVPEVAGGFVDQYAILRSTDLLNFSTVGYVPGGINGFNDLATEVMNERYFYKIQVVNGCPAANKIGESGSSVLLQSEKISETKGHLIWSPYEGWNAVESYEIQYLNEFDQWITVKIVNGSTLNTIVDF